MSGTAEEAGTHLFELADRGVLRVSGEDRVRWLDGMLTNSIAALDGRDRSGCYALLLTRQGRVVADLHVVARADSLWLETARAAVPRVIEQLGRLIVADDVVLEDISSGQARLGVEGPAAEAVLAAAAGREVALEADQAAEVAIGGHDCLVVAFGWSTLPARQLFVSPGAGPAVVAALLEAGAGHGLVAGDGALLERLRVEAGTPVLGAELDTDVLPAEARLERAISTTKGCYTGQEVVERLRSRNRVGHLLVGLRFEGDEPPPPGAELVVDGKRSGELTSTAHSPRFGAIGLGFLRSDHSAPGTVLQAAGLPARVAALPFASDDR